MCFYCFGVISSYLIPFRPQIKLRSCTISSWKLMQLRWKWIPSVKPQKDKVTKKRKKNHQQQMNVIIYANYKLNCTKDCSSSFAFVSFSNLISTVVSNTPVIQLNTSALEFVCSQMPGLRGSSFLFYLEIPIHQHPLVFPGPFWLILRWNLG